MTYSPYEPAPPERDRWGLNLPLAVGVVVVFLIAVVAWVLIDTAGGDDDSIGPSLPPPAPVSTATPTVAPAPTSTTPPLLPSTTPAGQPTTPPAATTPPATGAATPTLAVATTTTAAPAVPPGPTTTAAPPAAGDTVPGDLGVSGRPMQRPVCSGGYITVLGSNVASRTSAAGIAQLLEQYPGSEYLRTDQSCRSLDRSAEGEPIYVVFLGPFPESSDACIAREQGPGGSYARQLSDEVGPDHAVNCP